jgi:hypothetical protein
MQKPTSMTGFPYFFSEAFRVSDFGFSEKIVAVAGSDFLVICVTSLRHTSAHSRHFSTGAV